MTLLSVVIIRDFYPVSVTFQPLETDSPSIVDADAVLAIPISLQFFKAIARWDSQILERLGGIQDQ
jgi:hypothetical protein